MLFCLTHASHSHNAFVEVNCSSEQQALSLLEASCFGVEACLLQSQRMPSGSQDKVARLG